VLNGHRPIVVVSGALANKPGNGGAAWTRLSWPLGLMRLDCDVYFVEQIAPAACADASGASCEFERSANLAYFRSVTERFGLAGRASLVLEDEHEAVGLPWNELLRVADAADVLLNFSGHLTIDALKQRFRTRVFMDQDPGYTQFWLRAGLAEDRLRHHHFYVTVGENIGARGCSIPTGGINWRPVRQPVVLDYWPPVSAPTPTRFTTVASWRGPYGPVTSDGMQYGLKAHEFRKFTSLPRSAPQTFEIALAIDPADCRDVEAMQENGWSLVDARAVACDPFAFRRYIQESSAEFSVAQGIYVQTQSGWFSDRTVRYLASGKPALVQDTGFGQRYPTGRGLVPFRTLDEAVRGADMIAREYEMHSNAARAIAEEFFDSDKVITSLLRQVGVTS
jgi:hypothetical protein